MKTPFHIETGIPPVPNPNTRHSGPKYPLESLEVGQSFFVAVDPSELTDPADEVLRKATDRLRMRLGTACGVAAKQMPEGTKFTVLRRGAPLYKDDPTYPGALGVRVFRVK